MKVIPSTCHQCVTLPHNGIEMCILGDNTLVINNISVKSHMPLDRVSNEIVEESIECVTEPKTLNSEIEGCEVISLVEPLLPMEEEEEEISFRDWIYKEENDDGPIFDVYDDRPIFNVYDDDDEEVYILDQ